MLTYKEIFSVNVFYHCFCCLGFSVDPKDPAILYNWFEVGVLDYDEDNKYYLIQKVNNHGRILDTTGKPVVDGGIQSDGESEELYTDLCDCSM